MTKSGALGILVPMAMMAIAAGSHANNAPTNDQVLYQVPDDVQDQDHRSLVPLFPSLACNDGIVDMSTVCTKTWTEYIGASTPGASTTHASKIVIGCGECILFDQTDSTHVFSGGLEIQGKLQIPDGTTVTMETPFVIVKGFLEMTSSKGVDGEDAIKFLMTGTDSISVDTVDAGKKPFAVAGGEVKINGLPDDTPTWLPIHDISKNDQAPDAVAADFDQLYQKSYTPPPNEPGCSEDGVFIDETFSETTGSSVVRASPGSMVQYDGNTMAVVDRTHTRHGAEIDLKYVKQCLSADQKYLLTARVKLTNPNYAEGTPIQCTTNDSGCLKIRTEYMDENVQIGGETKYQEYESHTHEYGKWFSIAETILFKGNEVDSSNVYLLLRLFGPQAGTEIEIDDFSLRLPPPEVFPTSPTCADLASGNNQANANGLSPFPFLSLGKESNIVVEQEADGNNYFAVTGRDIDDPEAYHGIALEFPASCVDKGSVYHLALKLRAPDGVSGFVVTVKGFHEDTNAYSYGRSYSQVVTCPTNTGDWVQCEEDFMFTEFMVGGGAYKYQVYITTPGNPTVSYDVDDFYFTFVSQPLNKIIVDSSVQGKWLPGAEVVITPHGLLSYEEQVRTITEVAPSSQPGMVEVKLHDVIEKPSLAVENVNFATEVALLSRNIVMEGADDDTASPDHGGHLTVFMTAAQQFISGVEFKNFGQDGDFDGYPIHFYMCGDVSPGTTVEKNTIRNSNDGCVVLTGTNGLTVDQNVAYYTHGHCFILRTGSENNNVISNNIGVRTRDYGSATYYFTSVTNVVRGNVAAGSKSHGFYIKMSSSVKSPSKDDWPGYKPNEQAVVEFDGNYAHSNEDYGFRMEYYRPSERVYFTNIVSFRNKDEGIYMRDNYNIGFDGGILADNERGIKINRGDNTHITNFSIMGVSEEFGQLVEEGGATEKHCGKRRIVGIELFPFMYWENKFETGLYLENTEFTGFANMAGCDIHAFYFDDEKEWHHFDWATRMKNISLEDTINNFEFCSAADDGHKDVVLTDLDSSMQPSGSSYSGVSSIVSNEHYMTDFADCVKTPSMCSAYCNSCYRTLTTKVDPAETEDYKLQVCDKISSVCVQIPGLFDDSSTPVKNTDSERLRMFAASLPAGSYEATYLDGNGNTVWPTFVEEIYEEEQCQPSFSETDIEIQVPDLSPGECNDIIKNGGAEASNTHHTHWLHRDGGVQVVQGQGIDNSNALADITQSDGGDAISQYLDTRCLVAGSRYEIRAWVKLIKNGQVYLCDESNESCPEVGIYTRSLHSNGLKMKSWYQEPIAKTSFHFDAPDYQLIHGVFTITEDIANAQSALFYIERNKKGYEMFVDNVSMTLLSDDCSDVIVNGDFASGIAEHWSEYSGDMSVVEGVGGSNDYALSVFDGTSVQYLNSGCFVEGNTYKITARFQLKDATNSLMDCGSKCPRIDLKNSIDGEEDIYKTVGRTYMAQDSDGWGRIEGYYIATSRDANPESTIRFRFTNFNSDQYLIVDDVSLVDHPAQCDGNLVLNSGIDGGFGDLWDEYGTGTFVRGYVDPSTGDAALKYDGPRTRTWHGIEYESRYFSDLRCFEEGNYEVNVDVRLLYSNGTGVVCDKYSTSSSVKCPSVKVYMYDEVGEPNNERRVDAHLYNGAYASDWDAENFNHLKGFFTIPPSATGSPSKIVSAYIMVRDYNKEYDLVIDNFSVSRASATANPSASPSATPSASPTSSPSVSPSASPTSSPSASPSSSPSITGSISPTGFDNECGSPGTSRTILHWGNPYVISNALCSLTKVITDGDGEVTAVIPVARSYDNNNWEVAPGAYAASVLNEESFDCQSGLCNIALPDLITGESYVLSSYEYDLSERESAARFLEMGTFGTTTSDLDSLEGTTEEQWILAEMNKEPTSHREYFRERANPRWPYSWKSGRSDHPCRANSRWRRYSFTRHDRFKEPEYDSGYVYVKGQTPSADPTIFEGPYILEVDGYARTVVPDLIWRDSEAQAEEPYWDPNYAYEICSSPDAYTGGRFKLRRKSGSCTEISRDIGNPAINFAGFESYATQTMDLPNDGSLQAIDEYKDKNGGDRFILTSGLSDDLCNSLPEQSEDFDAPVFGAHETLGYLIWDPRLRFETNTLENQISDGGGSIELSTGGMTKCFNAPRTFLNEETCFLSTEASACGSIPTPDTTFALNSTNIVALQSLTGKYLYAMKGLVVTQDGINTVEHPCFKEGHRSRWTKTDGACANPTELGPSTKTILEGLIASSSDENPHIRDITFKSNTQCDETDESAEISITVGNDCWTHVHPEHLSVWDLTYWADPNTHPGNKNAENFGRPNPIKKWAEAGLHYMEYPSLHPNDATYNHPMMRWETNNKKFEKVGRFGDYMEFRDLTSELRLDQVAEYFGLTTSASGYGMIVCGSPGEVANKPQLGSEFEVLTFSSRQTQSSGDLARQRETVWTNIALGADDQLRQRMAWALSQILVIAKSAISSQDKETESFVNYYDIFVRNAFGNYMDVLREISYSPLMAENLSYLNSKSTAYIWEEDQRIEFADENFAREIMQLFSIGLIDLNLDGTPKLVGGATRESYTNEHIRSFARAWTGFTRQNIRANFEARDSNTNRVDPMKIVPEWRDRFPKSNLYGGYLGDGYPLCTDLPVKQFLKKGARYRLLGSSALPELMEDDSRFENRLVLDAGASPGLYDKLCAPSSGACTFPMNVLIDNNIECTGVECEVDTVRVVSVAGFFYEYIQPACVEQPFFENGVKLNQNNDNDNPICGNPLLPIATSACCENPMSGTIDAISDNRYDIERMTFDTMKARCAALDRTACEYDRVDRDSPSHLVNTYHWANTACSIQVKVNRDGEASIIHDVTVIDDPKVSLVNDDTQNYFSVNWLGDYPKKKVGDCGVCVSDAENNCICHTVTEDSIVFDSLPADGETVLSTLTIGAPNPASFDNIYTEVLQGNGFKVHTMGNGYQIDSIFEIEDNVGRTHYRKNAKSTVSLKDSSGNLAGYSFINPVHFMSFVPSETNARDAMYETEAALEHYFYHDNTAPFLCTRFIQRFGISNASPRFVKACATAFQTGLYQGPNVEFGTGKYGDLGATVASILLDKEARAVVLDADPAYGSLREPLNRVIGLMRSMDFTLKNSGNRGERPVAVFREMETRIGQFPHEYETVFSFFLPEYIPDGPISSGTLVAPESQLLDMPKNIDLINGLHSLIKYGFAECYQQDGEDYGFGKWNIGSGSCSDGSYNRATGTLAFQPSSESAADVVDELALLLTSGRLNAESRKIITEAYDEAPDTTAGLRIAMQLVTTTPEYHTTNAISFSGEAVPTPTPPQTDGSSSYKAIVFLFFGGGCDSWNMLVPKVCHEPPGGGEDAYTHYANIRTPIHLLNSTLREIDADGQANCDTFGVHENLPILQELYNANDLIFFTNTGVLGETSTTDGYRDNTPARLFSHDGMQREAKRVDLMDEEIGTGILGRIADALYKKGRSPGKTAIDSNTIAATSQPGSPTTNIVGTSGIRKFMPQDTASMNREQMKEIIGDLNNVTKPHSGFMAKTWSDSLLDALVQNEFLYDSLVQSQTTAEFGSSSLAKKMKIISKMINTYESRGVDSDVFYLSTGGWDTHSSVETRLASNFENVNGALTSFRDEMIAQEKWNKVTVVQASEFARTLTANSGRGSDHAWGGQYFMFGGDVKGGQILGEYPTDMTTDSPQVLSRGRLVPTTSWDQIWPGIAEWAGVNAEDLSTVVPNMDSFAATRFQRCDLFDCTTRKYLRR